MVTAGTSATSNVKCMECGKESSNLVHVDRAIYCSDCYSKYLLKRYGKFEVKTDDSVCISKEEYNKLIDDQAMLDALYCAGVDNWEGYPYAVTLKRSEGVYVE